MSQPPIQVSRYGGNVYRDEDDEEDIILNTQGSVQRAVEDDDDEMYLSNSAQSAHRPKLTLPGFSTNTENDSSGSAHKPGIGLKLNLFMSGDSSHASTSHHDIKTFSDTGPMLDIDAVNQKADLDASYQV
jgi:hypothetical protein